MQSVAKKLSKSAVFEERATVVRVESPLALLIESDSGRFRVKRAVSCLVEPREGDLVLAFVGEDGSGHVVAVLERSEPGPSTLSVEGDLVVKSRDGRVQIVAREGVDIVTPKEASVVAHRVVVNASEASLLADTISVVGEALRSEVGKVKLFGRSLDQVFDRVSQRVKSSYRTITELDRVRAKNVDHVAEGTLKMHAREAVVTADGLVKVDGDQIHLG